MNDIELPQPNIPLLRKAVEWAEAEAAKTDGTCMWNQEEWAKPTDCGTSYCIAGFAVINGMANAQTVSDGWGRLDLHVDGEEAYFSDAGQQVLGLNWHEAEALFYQNNTIEDVRRIAEQIAARAGERL